MPCVYMYELIEVWQETLRAKFKTKNSSVFPSIFDCTNINYSIFFLSFICLQFHWKYKNKHENISVSIIIIVQCSTTPLWIGGVCVQSREGEMNETVCTLVDGENQRCRTHGHSICVYIVWLCKRQRQKRIKVRCSQSSILGWWFLFDDFLSHTWHIRITLLPSSKLFQCCFWWTLHMQITNRRKQCHIP